MSRLPDPVRRGIEAALTPVGGGGDAVAVTGSAPIGGGCVNPAARIETRSGEAYFVKWNGDAPPALFAAEADGLDALASAGAFRVPAVVARGGGSRPDDPAWLLLEFVQRGAAGPGYGERLGQALAALHRSGAGAGRPGGPDRYGWDRDNFIGPLPQVNGTLDAWPAFWRDRRLEPQIRRALDGGWFGGGAEPALQDVLSRTDEALAPVVDDGPSLLHGDLWNGNTFPDEAHAPVVIDPAVYRGHREVDLAMTELFGGFPTGYLEAYDDAWPLEAGYREVRRPLYQLYYLLVHVNLFGSGYVARSRAAAKQVLAAL